MTSVKKQKIYNLLKGLETGDPEAVNVVNENKYIQHNPQTQEGGEGLAALFARLAKTNPKVEIVRLFEDGDYVFGHTIYDFSSVRIGFEIFRYEGEFVVEHWDNIQPREGNMVGGAIDISDFEFTESNRETVKNFIDDVFIKANFDRYSNYVHEEDFLEHSSGKNLRDKAKSANYQHNHRVLAEGNFVLSVCEGFLNQHHTSFYDLFRLQDQRIIEHWETTEKVPPQSEWKNNNGKF